MTIEILYPELCRLYGDGGNVQYLRACLPQAEFVLTDNRSEPLFVRKKPELLYLGSMSEPAQNLAAARLRPYAEALRERIAQGMPALVTGNAFELLGAYVDDTQSGRAEMLGLYPFYARRDMEHRHNSMFLGSFGDTEIVGYKSQFSSLHGEFGQEFLRVHGGFGNDLLGNSEGLRDGNLFATYLLGPFLVLNPPFTAQLLRLMGGQGRLAFEKEVMQAYDFRRAQLSRPGVEFRMGEHG